MSNVITMIVFARIISPFVSIYHVVCQFFITNRCGIITTYFCAINLVFRINSTPINFSFEQYFCIFNFHSKIFYLLDKFFRDFGFLSLFGSIIGTLKILFDQRLSYMQLKNSICDFKIFQVLIQTNTYFRLWLKCSKVNFKS